VDDDEDEREGRALFNAESDTSREARAAADDDADEEEEEEEDEGGGGEDVHDHVSDVSRKRGVRRREAERMLADECVRGANSSSVQEEGGGRGDDGEGARN
jgi:hypothetical protein